MQCMQNDIDQIQGQKHEKFMGSSSCYELRRGSRYDWIPLGYFNCEKYIYGGEWMPLFHKFPLCPYA